MLQVIQNEESKRLTSAFDSNETEETLDEVVSNFLYYFKEYQQSFENYLADPLLFQPSKLDLEKIDIKRKLSVVHCHKYQGCIDNPELQKNIE